MADNPNHHRNNKPLISGVHADIDFMDIDGVMVVPDTPDRISKQPKKFCEISSYDDSSLRNSVRDSRPIRERRNRLFGDGIHSAGIYSHPEGNLGDAAKKHGASNSAIPSSSSSSRQVSLSGVLDDKIFKHKDRHHHNDQERKDDRISRSSFDRISHHHNHRSKNPVLVKHGNITKFSPKSKQDEPCARKMGNIHLNPNKTVCLNAAGASKSTDIDNNGWVKVKVDHDGCAHGIASSVKGNDNICIITSDHDTASSYSRNDNKGNVKVRVDHDELIHSNAGSVKGNGNVYPIGTARDTEKGPSHSFRFPNANRKRLVRNGCISPNNIMKAKKKEDAPGIGVENAEEVAASRSSHPIIDVNEVTSKQNDAFRAKGKGLLIHDSSSTGHVNRRNDAGNSTNEPNKGKSIEDCIIVTDTHGNSSKNSFGRRINLFPSTSSPNKSMPSEVQICTPSASFRRPKKISGRSEKSTEVICLSSGGKSSTMKPLRDHGDFPERELGSSSAREDFCGEERESNSQTDNNSEAREIQLQADEMLARELQEQLYNETPIFASGERAVSLGGEELQEDALLAAFSAELDDSFDRFVSSVREQAPQPSRVPAGPQSLRARLFRGRSQAQPPRSNISSIRNQLYRSRGRRNHLSHMDVETRMRFLESLEAVYDEDRRMVNQLLNSDREFSENDYEMLLALDENNHAHLGASVAQIANLPVSTVINDNCETCSVCLETPVIGDTVRHLPCLHKFHKDCIDPWLRRKRSCPVCKSDI